MQNHPHASSSKQTDQLSIDESSQLDLGNDNNTASDTQMNVAESQRLPRTNTFKAYSAKRKEWKVCKSNLIVHSIKPYVLFK